ncbi:MAG: DUF4159 domain-containing protein [Isosphaeraceae bacterium]
MARTAGWHGPLVPALLALFVSSAAMPASAQAQKGALSKDRVDRAIRGGVRFLKAGQSPNGSWPMMDNAKNTVGLTALAALALMTAGEPIDDPKVAKALTFLQENSADELNSVYAISLQTMAFAAADPKRYELRIAANAAWLEKAQLTRTDPHPWAGSWTYTGGHERSGDNSNTQYALLGLNAASEAGIPIKAGVWELARKYWEDQQRNDGGWNYHPDEPRPSYSSMTCAGISSLIISGLRRYEGHERLNDDGTIVKCGEGTFSPKVQQGINWVASNFDVTQNVNRDGWTFYYLYGLERAGRLAGVRFFGSHDWYREGALELINAQRPGTGDWLGIRDSYENNPVVATSFALLFLSKGKAGVLINKLKHGPGNDWQEDPDDIRNLVGTVGKDWKSLLTWQVIDADQAEVEDLMMAPILFMNGHEAPELTDRAKKRLREYVEQGGFLLAEACCSEGAFDLGFRTLMKEVFPEREFELRPLSPEHSVWRARYELKPDSHPLLGIQQGCRTAVIYTPKDLSCFWNNSETHPDSLPVIKAMRLGQNIVDYATGRELPPDKLDPPKVNKIAVEKPKRNALQIAKIRHAGDWNVAPLAIPSLMTALRDELKFDVVLNHKPIFVSDPNLVNFPLLYSHGRSPMAFAEADQATLRRHLDPGGGILFADAACGSPAFDASFRKLVAELLPASTLEPIPPDDDLFSNRIGGYDLATVEYSQAAGGGKGRPQLEGVKLNGKWVVIYSKYDIGCALERQAALDCKGYSHDSALKLAANIVIYATLP